MNQHRRSIRLASYDYRAGGAYFITICAHEKRHVFGCVHEGETKANVYGEIMAEEWLRTAELRTNVMLDEWIVMPNHFHAIVIITHQVDADVGAHCNAPLRRAPQSLSSLVSGFKGSVNRHINTYRTEHNLPLVKVWQRNYFERIIRDEKELHDTRRYILENPINWLSDENFAPS